MADISCWLKNSKVMYVIVLSARVSYLEILQTRADLRLQFWRIRHQVGAQSVQLKAIGPHVEHCVNGESFSESVGKEER